VAARKIPRFWADLQIECLDIIIDNFQKSYFRRAQPKNKKKWKMRKM
jgi:hypothetical protein